MTTPDIPIDSTYVIDQGAGVPCIFLHGSLATSELWLAVIDRLKSRYRCLAPDLPDCGRSIGATERDWRAPALAAYIDNLLHLLGITQPVHVIVHGTGSLYGVSWAQRFPHRVKSLIILNTSFPVASQWHVFARLARMPFLGHVAIAVAPRALAARVMRHGSTLSPLQIERWCARLSSHSWQAAANLYRVNSPATFIASKAALHHLARSVPTIVIWGKNDRFAKQSLAQDFGTHHVVTLGTGGHWLPLESPETLASALLDFFAKSEHHTD